MEGKDSWKYNAVSDTWEYTKLELSRRVHSNSGLAKSSPMSKIINVLGTHLRSRQHSYVSVKINNDVVWSGAKSSIPSCQDEWIDYTANLYKPLLSDQSEVSCHAALDIVLPYIHTDKHLNLTITGVPPAQKCLLGFWGYSNIIKRR